MVGPLDWYKAVIFSNLFEPKELLRTILIYSCDFYGSLIWDLFGQKAEQLYKCWNTCIKLCWDLPRGTHTNFVKDFLSCDLPSIKTQCISRYVNFLNSILNSPSKEVAILARIVRENVNSITGRNILNIYIETGLHPLLVSARDIRTRLELRDKPSVCDSWDCWLLDKYLDIRKSLRENLDNTDEIDSFIMSLCTSWVAISLQGDQHTHSIAGIFVVKGGVSIFLISVSPSS